MRAFFFVLNLKEDFFSLKNPYDTITSLLNSVKLLHDTMHQGGISIRENHKVEVNCECLFHQKNLVFALITIGLWEEARVLVVKKES